jgi:hypothetical protein
MISPPLQFGIIILQERDDVQGESKGQVSYKKWETGENSLRQAKGGTHSVVPMEG